MRRAQAETQAQLQAYEALTVVVGAPLSSVSAGAAAPILDERFSITRAFSVTPATVAASLGVLLLGLGGIAALLWSKGRDRRWPGVTPGLDPPPGVATDEIRPLFTSPQGAVEFRPPRDLRPAQVGLLLDDTRLPEPGAKIVSPQREVGWITSSAYSPARQQNIALGYVRREVVTPGTPLEVRTQDSSLHATVADLPFYTPQG